MMKNILLMIALLAALAVAFTQGARGTPEIAEKEGQGCLVCHTAVGPADLNDRGKYYKDKGTLDGYEAPPEPPPPPQPTRPD